MREKMEYTYIYTWIISYIGWCLQTTGGQELPVYSVCSGQGLQQLDPEGYITSPGYPVPYSVSIQCTWNIMLPQSQRVKIEFLDMDLDKPRFHSGCHDMVRIIDGQGDELHRLCGDLNSVGPKRILFINDNRVTIKFRTYHDTYPGKGFKLLYSPIPCPPVPLSVGSLIESHDNVSSLVTCESGVKEPIKCVEGRWQPDLYRLGQRCVDITPAQTSTRKNLTGKKAAAGPGPGPGDSSNDNTGVVVGAVIGTLCFLVIIVIIIIFFIKRRKFRNYFRSKQTEKVIGSESKPLARPDVITIVPNYSDPVEGEYTEPVDENSPSPFRKIPTGQRETASPVKSTKSSTKSHSYDLPYQSKSIDIQNDDGKTQNFYDLPNSPTKDAIKVNGVKVDDNSSNSGPPEYPAPPTPEPPPLPEPNKVPSKVKIPPPLPTTTPRKTKPSRPSSQYDDPSKPRPPLPTTTPRAIKPRPKSGITPTTAAIQYEDDPIPYACVDIISASNPTPIVRTDSPALPEEDPPSVSSFKTGPHTRKL